MESRAILRVPLRWNDRTLLEDEPLCGYFATRSVVSEGRGRKGGVDWDKDIAEEVKRAPGGVCISICFSISFAFHANSSLVGGCPGMARHCILQKRRRARRDSKCTN